jgi:hypothetical protein
LKQAMTGDRERELEPAKAVLDRLRIPVPATDLPFLERTFARQRELLLGMAAHVPPETEPAHVFGPRTA